MVDEVLAERGGSQVVRRDATVRRPVHPWSGSVRALLDHLAAVDFAQAPRVLAVEPDFEVLSYLPGESGPDGWAKVVDEDGLRSAARLLRTYHDAVSTWRPTNPDNLHWADGTTGAGTPSPGKGTGTGTGTGNPNTDTDDTLVCHGDVGPWNLVWSGTTPIGLIDWEYAHVAPRVSDIAYALEYLAPFRSDEEAIRWLRYPSPPDRARRIRMFADAYGLPTTDGLVDAVIAEQTRGRNLVASLAEQGQPRQVELVADGHLTEIDARIAWSMANRHRCE